MWGGNVFRLCMSPTGFFHFHIRFCQKMPTSEVNAPPTARHPPPPMGNPGSATGLSVRSGEKTWPYLDQV